MIKGQSLTEKEIQRIVVLLRETELSMTDIGKRMDCSNSYVSMGKNVANGRSRNRHD